MILRNIFHFIIITLLIISSTTQAEIVLDSTLGIKGALQGPDFAIDASLGKQVGANLFHSFASFNLNSSKSAIFIGSADINNVINRVIGGKRK